MGADPALRSGEITARCSSASSLPSVTAPDSAQPGCSSDSEVPRMTEPNVVLGAYGWRREKVGGRDQNIKEQVTKKEQSFSKKSLELKNRALDIQVSIRQADCTQQKRISELENNQKQLKKQGDETRKRE